LLFHFSPKFIVDKFAGVCDKLTTFSARKTCLGQDSAITTCRDSASRFASSSLCFDVLAKWTLKNDRRTNLFNTPLIQ